MSMPSSSDAVATSALSFPSLSRCSASSRFSFDRLPWCDVTCSAPTRSDRCSVSRSASRRVLTNTSVVWCSPISCASRSYSSSHTSAAITASRGDEGISSARSRWRACPESMISHGGAWSVGRGALHHRLPLGARRVARPHERADRDVGEAQLLQRAADFGERLGQVLLNVVRQRLERRDVDHLRLVGQWAIQPLAHQRVDRGEERRERLPRAGRSRDQGIVARLNHRPGVPLRLGGRGEARAEPAAHGWVKTGERHESNLPKIPRRGYRPTIAPSEAPRVAAMRSIVSPILLLGVEAPAVTPIVSGPCGSHASRRCSTFAPTGRKRMVPPAASMQLASSMWNVVILSWQMAARCVVLLEL